jgi:uncharacterized protein (TIGR03435 family)
MRTRLATLAANVRAIMFAGLFATAAFAQSPPPFEVASVKLNQTQSDPHRRISGPRAIWTAYPLVGLLMEAYDIQSYQISGGPAWIMDRFDIEALVAGKSELTKTQARELLRAVLEDRFHLKAHREKKEMAIYALVVAKSGPKLKESSADVKPGMTLGVRGQMVDMKFTAWSMARLAEQIAGNENRKVVDKTGLAGSYDFALSYLRDRGADAPNQDGPSLFAAVQEQLGLRVESQKGLVEMLVVEHADRPSPN